MKRIINGKKYDTETARKLGSWDNGYYPGDFDYCECDLYLKKTGEFFLAGEGGARSMFSRPVGNGWTGGGSGIIPLSKSEGMEWAERVMEYDDYIELFPDTEE